MEKTKKAIVLLSGGLDSATTAAVALAKGFDIFCLSFRYGQRHSVELHSARNLAALFHATEHLVIDIDLAKIGGSALTDNINVPKNRNETEMRREIPITYVPARNTIFLSYALAWAEVLGIADIFIGVNAIDYSGYPDCRPEYIISFERMANLATKAAVENRLQIKINTPLIEMTKTEIIIKGTELGVDFSLTHSCYDPLQNGRACGQCDSCLLRKEGFEKAGIKDPVAYS